MIKENDVFFKRKVKKKKKKPEIVVLWKILRSKIKIVLHVRFRF